MLKRPALRNLTTLAVFVAATALLALPNLGAQAGDLQGSASSRPGGYGPAGRSPGGVGAYSMTLRDVWGPAEMPPTPKDFGPHFDFQPEPLSGGLSQDPYPN
jgi:hypothetical protein